MQNVKVTAMMRVGSASSFLLHGFFCSHKEVSSLPICVEVYDSYEKEDSFLSPEEYLDLFIDNNGDFCNLKEYYKGCYCTHEIKNIDRSEFCRIFFFLCEKYGECGRKEYFLLLHIALFLLRGGGRDCLKDLRSIFVRFHDSAHIVYTKVNQRRGKYSYKECDTLFLDFPNARLFIPMRDPVYNIETTGGNPFCREDQTLRLWGSHKDMITWGMLCTFLSKGVPVFVLKSPDLHRHFDAVMKAVSAFLEITYDPSIQESTFWGNRLILPSSKQEVQTNRANPDFIDWKGGILSEYEISVTRFFFRDVLATFFPENAKPLRLVDYLRVGKFCLRCVFSVFKVRSLREGYHDYFVPFRDFLRFYPRLKKFPSLDLKHVKTYEREGNC
ncbi:MAG: hypothetical protein LBF76_02895 [Holosporales bacterium]|nr:hypothetical protein [Holosporales bacterium]